MPLEFNVTDEDISRAEEILLKEGKHFDEQRRSFIKDFNTLDLQAVPGSGKTTALLAKLISLDRQIPTNDRRGILVLSHTNAAVDEIKYRIGPHSTKLFSSPNFIGTIQSFVDTFLAIPYYGMQYNSKPVRIDDELYRDFHHPDPALRTFLNNQRDGNSLLYEYTLRNNDELKKGIGDTAFRFRSKTTTFQKILAIKKNVRHRGILCFDDAYILASEYIEKYPPIVDIIRSRFCAVFVDEMQDMERHQYDLIERLFNTPDISLQRIGDKNQAIYGDDKARDDFWVERNVKEINGSHRLSASIASIVQGLALRPIIIQGLATNSDNSLVQIKPHIIIYNNETKEDVLQEFGAIIERLIETGKIPVSDNNIFKAVAWTTAKPDDNADKLKLNSFYPLYSKEQQSPKIAYDTLESYLFYFNGTKPEFKSIRKNILNALLSVLRLEGILQEGGKPFTKQSLIEYISVNASNDYPRFKSIVYEVCLLAIQGDRENAYQLLVELCNLVLKVFNRAAPGASRRFIITRYVPIQSGDNIRQPGEVNSFCYNDSVTIDVGTVHSIKGQTHTGTLYLESFYQRQYESTRLADQLKGIALPDGASSHIRQSMKMAYVGFSRPTHLLCFAVHQTRFEESLSDIDREVWVVNENLLN